MAEAQVGDAVRALADLRAGLERREAEHRTHQARREAERTSQAEQARQRVEGALRQVQSLWGQFLWKEAEQVLGRAERDALDAGLAGPLGHVRQAQRDTQLAATLDAVKPDAIVNAVAYTAVDRAEDEPDLALRINARALAEIGAHAASHKALVVHYSTDYVFDGAGSRPYRENDATAPLGVYGRSKLDGENALRASGCDHPILRTAWVYAARGHNFLRTMLRLAREREELRVVGDQRGAPTPARLISAKSAAHSTH